MGLSLENEQESDHEEQKQSVAFAVLVGKKSLVKIGWEVVERDLGLKSFQLT